MTYDEKVICHLLKNEENIKKFLMHRCDRFLKEKKFRMFSRTISNFHYDYNKIPNIEEYQRYVDELPGKEDFCVMFVKYSQKTVNENFDFLIDMMKDEYKKEKLAEVIGNIDFEKVNLEKVKEEINRISAATDLDSEEKEGFVFEGDVDEIVYTGQHMKTGFEQIDRHIYGFTKKEYYLYFGRTGTGKTLLLFNHAYKLAEQGYYGIFFTLEMPFSQMKRLFYSRFSQIKANDIKFGKVSREELEIIQMKIQQARFPLFFVEKSTKSKHVNIEYIRSKIRSFKKKHPLEFIVIDYLNMMREDYKQDRVKELGYLSEQLKNIAKEENIVILSAVQANRELLKAVDVGIEHIGQSDAISYACDFIAFIKRGKLINNIMNMKILKHREGPTNVDAKFLVDFSTKTIEDVKE